MDLFHWAIFALLLSLSAGTLEFADVGRATIMIARGFFGIFLAISLVLLVLVVMGFGAMTEL